MTLPAKIHQLYDLYFLCIPTMKKGHINIPWSFAENITNDQTYSSYKQSHAKKKGVIGDMTK